VPPWSQNVLDRDDNMVKVTEEADVLVPSSLTAIADKGTGADAGAAFPLRCLVIVDAAKGASADAGAALPCHCKLLLLLIIANGN
jgi:hypothetical protein